MASMPRIITVDPTGAVGRIVRSAMDLVGFPVILSDIPTGTEALEEVNRSGCDLIFSAWELHKEMNGLELAMRVKQVSDEIGIVILGDDAVDLDDETIANSPFAYISRPVDVNQFLRVLMAGIDNQNVKEALEAPVGEVAAVVDLGPVPPIDLSVAQGFVESLLTDLGAMAILLVDRGGEVLLASGAAGYLDRERLAHALLPGVMINIDLQDLVGGQSTALQFYDGDDHDVFVLSVGLHYFMCVVFDGQGGSRQFGAVNRFGRRASQDLVALLGPHAWMVEHVVKEEVEKRKTQETETVGSEPAEPIIRADFGEDKEEEIEPEPVIVEPELVLDAIPDEKFDVDDLFASDVEVDEDMFDLDKLGDIARDSRKSKTITFDDAQELGILGD